MDAYEVIPHHVLAVPYDGSNAASIADAAGAENVAVLPGGILQVRPGGGPWTFLPPGWWVVLHDGAVRVVSAGAFAATYRPASGVV